MENKIDVEKTLLETKSNEIEVKAYKRRWIILLTFMFYAGVNAFQWIEYSTITHIIMKYYNVSAMAVDWTSIIYMATYPFLVIPASYIMDKKGLRTAGLIGCIGTFIGAGVKLMSLRRDFYIVVLIGQFINAASQVFILCLPPKIAAVWFKANEVSTACSLGVFGTMFGNALGFILPSLIVKNSDNLDEIGNNLKVLCWIITASMMPVTIAVLIYFPHQPPLPPSLAQAKFLHTKTEFKSSQFYTSVVDLLKNQGFVIHMFAYGINIGVFSAVSTLLSQFVMANFEGADDLAGKLGFTMIMVGLGGSILFGIILDKTHKYKAMTILTCFCSAISIFLIMFALRWKSIYFCYIAAAIMGFFTNAYMPVGFELAMELTYPSEQSTTTGILLSMSQILGFLFTVALGYMNLYMGYFWSLSSQALLLLLSTATTIFVPNTLNRQDAYTQQNSDVNRKPSFHGSKLLYIQ